MDISDLPTVKRIHSVKDGFLKSPFYEKLITDSSSVFNTIYPDVHRKYKRLLSNPMSETGLKAFLPRIDAKMRLAIKRIADENREEGRADVAKWFMFLSFDVIGDLAFGESFGNLERGIVSEEAPRSHLWRFSSAALTPELTRLPPPPPPANSKTVP